MIFTDDVLIIFSTFASVGFVCNIVVVWWILNGPMKTPNVRYLLMLTVALLFEQLFSFPVIYVRFHGVCEAAGALETYFQMVMLCASCGQALVAYYQIFK
jgi:hypothetical protein